MAGEAGRQDFVVPSTSGQYAPERLTFGGGRANTAPLRVWAVTAVVEAAVAASSLELWVLKPGTDSSSDANFVLYGQFLSGAAVGADTFQLADWPVVQLRAKSGGTAGTLTVSAAASVGA